MKTTISINQLLPLANQPMTNFETMKETIAKNSADGSKLSVFPEDFLYGILRNEAELVSAGRQFEMWVVKFCDLAKRYNIDIIPGTFPSVRDGCLYNSTVYIDKTGEVLTRYSKNNLWLSERDGYQPALQCPKVFDSVLGKTVVIICWDILDHRLFESAVKQNTEWVIILAFWSVNQSRDMAETRGKVGNRYAGFSDSRMIDVLIQSRVSEYDIGLIFCNFAGRHNYLGSTGPQYAVSANRSQLVTPYINILCRASNRKEVSLNCETESIMQAIVDFETHYGRRQDIVHGYPWNRFSS